MKIANLRLRERFRSNRSSIAAWLRLGFAIVAILLAAVGALNWYQTHSLSSHLSRLAKEVAKCVLPVPGQPPKLNSPGIRRGCFF